jgi:hypothetical protein
MKIIFLVITPHGEQRPDASDNELQSCIIPSHAVCDVTNRRHGNGSLVTGPNCGDC